MRSAIRFRTGLQLGSLFKSTWRPVLTAVSLAGAIVGTVLSLLIVLWSIFEFPIPFACALLAGALVREAGQWMQVRRLSSSRRPFPFAAFHFGEGRIHCEVREGLARPYVTRLHWKMAAALVAGGLCWELQRWSIFDLQWLPGASWGHPHPLLLLELTGRGQPLFVGAILVIADGPVKRWTKQLQSALQARADRALVELQRDREIDGLDRAIGKIHEQLGCSRSSTYRSAIEKRLRAQTEALVLEPQSMSTLVEALTEAARLEWSELAEGWTRFREIEAEMRALRVAANVLQEPVLESRAEEWLSELREITPYLSHWRWEEFRDQLVQRERQVDDTHRQLQERKAAAPAPVLAPGFDPYRLLGADPSVPTAAIRRLRLRLAQVYHPDIGGETCNAAKMAEVNAAYDAILREREGNFR